MFDNDRFIQFAKDMILETNEMIKGTHRSRSYLENSFDRLQGFIVTFAMD
jgi:hypothetical protein